MTVTKLTITIEVPVDNSNPDNPRPDQLIDIARRLADSNFQPNNFTTSLGGSWSYKFSDAEKQALADEQAAAEAKLLIDQPELTEDPSKASK